MKKIIAALFVLGLTFGFVACNQATDIENQEVVLEFEEDNQLFTLEALSAATLLDYSSVSELSYVPLAETTEEELEELDGDELITEEVDELDQYLELMNNYLGDNDALTVTVLESDREAYVNLISFITVNASGDEVVYYLYFNETIYEAVADTDEESIETTEAPDTEAETETEEAIQTSYSNSNEGTPNFIFQDEDDESVVYSLEGVILFGETEYNVEGKKVVLESGAEITRLYAWEDNNNFVKVSYKTDPDDGNTKFFYEVKEEGVIVSKSRIQVVSQDGAFVYHLDFEDEYGKAEYIFSIVEEEGATLIHIKYDIRSYTSSTREMGNIHVEVTEDPNTGELIYTYKILGNSSSNKYSKQIEKKHQNKGQSNSQSNGNGNI